jgi:hypothetical protein
MRDRLANSWIFWLVSALVIGADLFLTAYRVTWHG